MEKSNGMTMERLEALLDAYGASPARWPGAERPAAEDLVARSQEARLRVDEARHLDLLLAEAPLEAPSAALTARLLAARPRQIAASPVSSTAGTSLLGRFLALVWPYGSPAFPAGAVLASLALGIVTGVGVSSLAVPQQTALTTVASADLSGEPGGELVSLALAHTSYPEDWTQ
ncbi:MAG: hypothetical protein PW790_09500 [Parvibaculaceae bacterium]|nr:hypothetical protein [Parvibaculaceae bacterium]